MQVCKLPAACSPLGRMAHGAARAGLITCSAVYAHSWYVAHTYLGERRERETKGILLSWERRRLS